MPLYSNMILQLSTPTPTLSPDAPAIKIYIISRFFDDVAIVFMLLQTWERLCYRDDH